jgi:hypothetical protein
MDTIDPSRDDAVLYTLLYVSQLATGGAPEIAQICRESRANNARDRVTGVLVFDGAAFCQFVEGPEAAIASLLDRLERDPRHVGMHVLHLGRTPWARRFSSWRLGYAYSADPAAIARIASTRGDAALAAFDGWVPALDASDAREA